MNEVKKRLNNFIDELYTNYEWRSMCKKGVKLEHLEKEDKIHFAKLYLELDDRNLSFLLDGIDGDFSTAVILLLGKNCPATQLNLTTAIENKVIEFYSDKMEALLDALNRVHKH